MCMEKKCSKKNIADHCYRILLKGIKHVENEYIHFPHYSEDSNEDGNEVGNKTLYRERVFCYELYHQIRKIQEEHAADGRRVNFDVNGEPDKRGQELFKDITGPIPDMIFHKIGSEKNYLVLEVKCSLSGTPENDKGKPTGIYKDFVNLSDFINIVHYELGVFLVYGVGMEELNKKFDCIGKFLSQQYSDKLKEIFSHLRVIFLDESGPNEYYPIEQDGMYLLRKI